MTEALSGTRSSGLAGLGKYGMTNDSDCKESGAASQTLYILCHPKPARKRTQSALLCLPSGLESTYLLCADRPIITGLFCLVSEHRDVHSRVSSLFLPERIHYLTFLLPITFSGLFPSTAHSRVTCLDSHISILLSNGRRYHRPYI